MRRTGIGGSFGLAAWAVPAAASVMSAAQAASRVLDMARILRGASAAVVVRASGPPSSQRRIRQTITLPGVNSRLEKYAQLVVRTGANVQAGQTLLVEADVEHGDLARAIADEAYAAGAAYVDVLYRDPWLRRVSDRRAAPTSRWSSRPRG